MIDTLIVIFMLATPIDTAKKETISNRKEVIQSAFAQASISVLEATKTGREKILNFDDIRAIVDGLKRNSIITR